MLLAPRTAARACDDRSARAPKRSASARPLSARSVPPAILVFGILLSVAASGVAARSDAARTSAVCDAAAAIGAAAHGVPLDVMRAVTRTETGRAEGGALRPWPWTVNMEGAGRWFESRAEATAYVRKHHERGARSYDVGCFQINFRWHGEAFDSLEEMFDPAANARYAARFLSELKAEGGSWRDAVGRYHSRTPDFARKYKARFSRILAALDPFDRAAAPRLADRGPTRPGGAAIGGPRFARMMGSAAWPADDAEASSPAASAGGVALSTFPTGRGLLTAGRPLGN